MEVRLLSSTWTIPALHPTDVIGHPVTGFTEATMTLFRCGCPKDAPGRPALGYSEETVSLLGFEYPRTSNGRPTTSLPQT